MGPHYYFTRTADSNLGTVTFPKDNLKRSTITVLVKVGVRFFEENTFSEGRNELSAVTLLWGCTTTVDTATHCNTLQHTATQFKTLQHTSRHCTANCNTLQITAKIILRIYSHFSSQFNGEVTLKQFYPPRVTVHHQKDLCSVLQCAVHCVAVAVRSLFFFNHPQRAALILTETVDILT